MSSFPSFGFFADKDLKKTKEKLVLAGLKPSPAQYLSFSLVFSLALSVLAFLFLLASVWPGLSLALSLLSFALFYLFFTKLPGILAKRRGKTIEADLPIVLRSMAAELGTGIAFEKCLAHSAASGHAISPELARAVWEIEHTGTSIPDALRGISARVDSIMVKRALQQMIEAYRQGSGVQGLKHLADELIETQKAISREYNASMAFLGLLFVALSCIVPSLFQAYVLVGSSFLYAPFSASDIWFIYLVAFPAVNLLVLLAIHERTPRGLGRRKEDVLSSKQIFLADKALSSKGIGINFKTILAYSLAVSFFLFAILLVLSLIFPYPAWFSIAAFALPLFTYFFVTHMVEQRMSALEHRLPDALLQASSFPKGVHTDRIIKSIAESDYGPLSEEFLSAHAQIASGADTPSSLKLIAEENDSVLLSRACGLLSQAYASGGDMHKAFKETAEDIFSTFSIIRERESALALQKYTLLFAGSLIVPAVLGLVAGFVFGLSTQGMEFISSTTPAERAALMAASVGAAQAYLVIYSLLASLFISQLQGTWRSFFPYFIAMAPVSLLVYNLALNFRIMTLF